MLKNVPAFIVGAILLIYWVRVMQMVRKRFRDPASGTEE